MSMQSIWVISDGAAGNRRQALALAAALGGTVRELMLRPRAPWSWLAPCLTQGGRLAWEPHARAQLAPPWPDLAIGCGRQAALATRLLRDLGEGRCRSVQILDPRCAARHWDVVVAPRHDGLRGNNVLNPLGSLHPVDATWLQDARAAWQHFAHLPTPRIGVLLGGPRRGVALDAAWRSALGTTLRALLRQGGSVLITASRRTPAGLVDACLQALGDHPRQVWRGAADGVNPYPAVLAWSDRLLVSPDSVNMLSEAAACGVPVHSVVTAPLPPRLARFHAALRAGGWLLDPDAAYAAPAPLRETPGIAARVRSLLQQTRAD
jgi:mitochondrial fission protein ELM1